MAVIAECFSTSSALRRLERTVVLCPDPRGHVAVVEDIATIGISLNFTFSDVHNIFGGLVPPTSAISYRQTWRELEGYFQEQSNDTLRGRLMLYQQFIKH